MARFCLLTIIALVFALPSHAAQEGVSDEFRRLEGVGSKALLDKGYACVGKCRYDSALIYYSVVANRYYANKGGKTDLKYIIAALQDIGIIYMVNEYDYKKSYDYLLQAKELAEKSGITEKLPNIYNCIANILQTTRQENDTSGKNEVMDMLKKSFYSSIQNKDYDGAGMAMTNIVSMAITADIPQDITREISAFMKLPARNTRQRRYAILYCNGYMENRARHYAKAVECFMETIENVSDNPLYYRSALLSYNCITGVYIGAGQYDKALDCIFKTLDFARKNNCQDYMRSLYYNLMCVYKEMGDSANVHKYEYLYLKEKDRLFNTTQAASVRNVKFIRELNQANEQVRDLSEKRRVQTYLLSAAAVVVCVIGILLVRLLRAYGKLRQANKHLYKTNVELLASEAAVRRQRERQDLAAETKIPLPSETNVVTDDAALQQKTKYQGSRMSETETKELYERVLRIMETSDEIFHLGFNIDKLSELVHSRSRYVSQAINMEYGANFNQLLNEYRIKEACRRLNGKEGYGNMTIESIAESVGFKSRTSFGALFKNSTGLSPSAYQRMARESGKNVL